LNARSPIIVDLVPLILVKFWPRMLMWMFLWWTLFDYFSSLWWGKRCPFVNACLTSYQLPCVPSFSISSFLPPTLGGHNFLILALFWVIFGMSDVPAKGLPLLFGHHQQQSPPLRFDLLWTAKCSYTASLPQRVPHKVILLQGTTQPWPSGASENSLSLE
jgi:hypothetical protein